MSEGKKKILVTDQYYADTSDSVAADFPNFEIVCPKTDSDLKSLLSGSYDAILVQEEKLDREAIESISDLKAVIKLGRNYNNIDPTPLRERGIVFASAPRKGPNCVAELAVTLMLALSKQLLMSHTSVAEGAYRLRGLKPELSAQWKMAFHWMRNEAVHEVRRKTVGIIGMGEIGCEIAIRSKALGMDAVYNKRSRLNNELEERYSVTYMELNDLLAESDYVCIVVPHTKETEKLIGKKELDLMKESAYLVNVCRGGVVDEEALIDALANGGIAGAGLDVFTYEPLHFESPLCNMHNVILTPHIGGGSGTNKKLELTEGLEEAERILAGEQPQVNLS